MWLRKLHSVMGALRPRSDKCGSWARGDGSVLGNVLETDFDVGSFFIRGCCSEI